MKTFKKVVVEMFEVALIFCDICQQEVHPYDVHQFKFSGNYGGKYILDGDRWALELCEKCLYDNLVSKCSGKKPHDPCELID
jgi:hypothetical protein